MEPYLPIILSLIVFASLGCFTALVFGGLLILFITSFRDVLTTKPSAPPAEDFLASVTLRPWEPGAASDISCRWKGKFSYFARLGHYESYTRGVVKSFRDPDGPGWFAFTVDSDHRRGERKAVIRLKTSAQLFQMEINGPLLQPTMHVQVWLDGMELGSVTVSHSPSIQTYHPTCLYRSADRATQAEWSPVFRPKGAFFLNKVFDYDPDYYPLIINNRTVASIADIWIRNPRANAQRPFPAAVRLMNNDLGAEEQNSIIMMLGLSLYFDTLRTHRRFKDW